MGVFTRHDSPFYWIWLERPGRKGKSESTKVPIGAPTPGQRRDQRFLAAQIYRARMTDLARQRHRIQAGERVTIGFTAYAEWYQAHFTVHKRTAARERSAIKNLIAHFKPYDLDEIDKGTVIEWRTFRKRHVKASTVNRELDVLKHMLKEAVPTYLDHSPIAGLNRLRSAKAAIRIFTTEEEVRFFAATKDLEEAAIMLIARDTLMRLSDVKSLQWANCRGDYIMVIDPKIEAYTAPVSPRLREVLEALPRRGRFLFPSRQSGPGSLSANTVHRLFVEICQRAEIPQGRKRNGVTFHSLRHTGTTRALERAVPVRGVQAAGGWQSIKQLERYGHVTDENVRLFRERIGQGDDLTQILRDRIDGKTSIH